MAGPGIANFYNIYDPAQGTLNGLLSLPNFMNPVQFICGGSFDTAGGPSAPDYFRRAEICRERLGPVLRRLTVNYPPIMFHPLNTITAYKGQIIYDTPATEAKAADAGSGVDLDSRQGIGTRRRRRATRPTCRACSSQRLPDLAPSRVRRRGTVPRPARRPACRHRRQAPARYPVRPRPLPAEQGAGR